MVSRLARQVSSLESDLIAIRMTKTILRCRQLTLRDELGKASNEIKQSHRLFIHTKRRVSSKLALQHYEQQLSSSRDLVLVKRETTVKMFEAKGRRNRKNPFVCNFEECRKVFPWNWKLQVHMRIHTRGKPYVCGCCLKAFSHYSNLSNHKRIHTGEKPFACKFIGCGKAFTQTSHLQLHVRGHTGEKPFICHYSGCKKAFKDSHGLKIHTRVHTGEKPFRCQVLGCRKSFSQLSNAKDHMRRHAGEKSFICDHQGCKKRFASSSERNQHHRIHTGEKPSACKEFGKHLSG